MDRGDKRRQARLQGRHGLHVPKTHPVYEKEISLEQSRCRNEVEENDVVSPPVVHHVDTSSKNAESQETDSQEVAGNSERPRDGSKNHGRKYSQRDFNPRQRGCFYPSRRGGRKGATNYENYHVSSDGSVDETLQSLNGLSVNIDIAVNSNHRADQHSHSKRSYPLKNGKHMPQRANNRNQFYADTNDQKYNSKVQSKYLNRGRSGNRFARNRPRFDRTYYSTEESAVEDTSIAISYVNECRTEIQRSVSVDNYNLTRKSRKDSNVDGMNGNHQRPNFGKSSKFVYEETNQAETVIQKIKGPTTLSINGWHKMVQRSPEDKESLLYFKPDFLGEEERENYYLHLKESISWQEKEIIIRGEKYMQPRLVAWYGPLPYSYSNSFLEPNCELPPVILDLKERIEKILRKEQKNVTFNSVLLNLYRDGKDSVAWHSDDELSMGIHPTIASVSLGETRRFEMKLKQVQKAEQQESEEYVIHLTSGSLLVMDGAMQQYWLHRVPKEFHDRNCRINLTFRTVYPMKEK